MQNIIEIKHVTAYRGHTRVFNDLSLDIASGCHTAILGPNGAGKSTLLKLLSRDLYPSNARVALYASSARSAGASST